MAERFELWDVAAGNLIGVFATEIEALVEVRGLLAVNGADYADDLALARRWADGGEPIAEGTDLAHLAERSRPDRRTA
jgi:hypothetical protein